jgi:hypothetical protein
MPRRPRQHEIDELGEQILRSTIPAAWTVDAYKNDYGKDYVVEIFEGKQPTGVIFHVQLKSSETLRMRKDGARTVRVERDRLRYYVDRVAEPLFIVGVDVTTRECVCVCVQEIYSGAARTEIEGNGTKFVPLREHVDLQDLSRFRGAVDRAWRFMRNQRPGTIKAAAAAKLAELRQAHLNLDFEISFVDGQEKVHIKSTQPVELEVRFVGDPEKIRQAKEQLLAYGEPVTASEELQIQLEGLPIHDLARGNPVSVQFSIQRPVEVQIQLIDTETSRMISLPMLTGTIEGGRRKQRIKCGLSLFPISMDIDVETESRRFRLHWSWDPSVWVGQSISLLPWLDSLRTFLSGLSWPSADLQLTLFAQGNELVTSQTVLGDHLATMREFVNYTELLDRARTICRSLKIDAHVPREWKEQDYDDVEELHSLVTTGSYTKPNRYSLGFTFEPEPDTDTSVLQKERGVLRFQHREARYDFLDTQFDFSEVVNYVDRFEVEELRRLSESEGNQAQVKLRNCRVRLDWPRFLTDRS